MDLGVALEAGARQDHEVRVAVAPELEAVGAHEHLFDEERLVGLLGHHHELAAVGAPGAGEAADDERVALAQALADAALDAAVVLLGDGAVDLSPADGGALGLGVHDEAVLGRAAAAVARAHDEGARGRELALLADERLLHQLGHGEVPVDVLLLDADAVGGKSLVEHGTSSGTRRPGRGTGPGPGLDDGDRKTTRTKRRAVVVFHGLSSHRNTV